MRTAALLNVLLLAAFLAMSAWLWPSLPEPIPVHFGLDGTPDRWGSRATWWLLPGLAVFLTVFLGALGRWSTSRPHLVNLPGKERLLALPPERRRPVLTRVADLP